MKKKEYKAPFADVQEFDLKDIIMDVSGPGPGGVPSEEGETDD